ncbi:MAG: pilus assembly protein PilM [Candidatus Omnitrophica bacterium]|nr:pilus assembly protein PilM [Candidatus Omnitrophota bacterium]
MEKFDFKKFISRLIAKKISEVIVVDSRTSLKLINLSLKGEIKVKAVKIIQLPAANKQDEVITRLVAFVKENNIEHRNIILCPALKSLQGSRLQMPAVPDHEIFDALNWKLKEDFALDASKSVVDYQVISRTAREDGSKVLDLICVHADENEVRGLASSYKTAGFNCFAVNLAVFGYAKMMSKCLKEHGPEAIAILQVMDDASYFTVYKENKVVFYRQVPITIADLKESLSSEIVTEQGGRVRLTPEEINKLLFDGGIPLEANQVAAMLRPVLERMAQEVKRSLDYYRSQFSGDEVKKVFIAGDGVKINNLDKSLAAGLACDVSFISWAEKIAVDPKVDKKLLPEVCGVIGLAIDFESGINLLPKEFKSEKIERFQKSSLRWAAFIAALLLAVSFIFAKAGVGLAQKRLDNAILHLSTLSEIREIKVRLDSLNAFITNFKNAEPPVGLMLKKLSNIAASGLFFNSLSMDFTAKTGSITGSIKPQPEGAEGLLAKLVKDMSDSRLFINPDIDIVQKQGANSEGSTFKINFQLP